MIRGTVAANSPAPMTPPAGTAVLRKTSRWEMSAW
jgi:hypothetical protein